MLEIPLVMGSRRLWEKTISSSLTHASIVVAIATLYRSRGTVVGASVKVTSPLTLKLDIQLTLRLLNILYFIPVLRLVCITTLKVT